MKSNVMLLNVLRYEKEGKKGTRLSLMFTDKESFTNGDKFKGFTAIDIFYNGHEVFEKVPYEWIGKPVIAYSKDVVNPVNPLRKKQVIYCLEHENNSIDLL